MSVPLRVGRPLIRVGIVLSIAMAAITGQIVAPGFTSEAEASTLSVRALDVAASKKGSSYQYGAVGPYRFDCSGLTFYSFKRAGMRLPRTAQRQYESARRISASDRRLGDLVFFHSGSNVYHVGIYAGGGKIWHAPKTGAVVRLEKIWTRSVWYGRFG